MNLLDGDDPLGLKLDLDEYTKAMGEMLSSRASAINRTMAVPSHLLDSYVTSNLCSEITLPSEIDQLKARIQELEETNQTLEEALVDSINQQVIGS